MESKHIQILKSIWINVCRYILSAVFVFSGFAKLIDPYGSFYKLQDYAQAFHLFWLPDFLIFLFGVLLAGLELCVGLFLFLGVRRTISTFLALALMAVMTPLTLVLAVGNPVSDCGCFGDALVLTNWQTFGKNVFLLIFSIILYKYRKQIFSFFTNATHWLVSLYTVIYVVALFFYSYWFLPVIDFRPFKVGVDIEQAMRIPEGAEEPVFVTKFLMEKDGKQELFDLENYPDSTWSYIDSTTKQISVGYVPPIQNLHMIDLETGEDRLEEFLEIPGYKFLLVAHDITNADDGNIDLINEIYDYSVEYRYPFVCLTSSLQEDINKWSDQTGAEYKFYSADDITLKTIIRSNPGLLLLKDGVIIKKWSRFDLPNEFELSTSLDKTSLGSIDEMPNFKKLLYIAFWYLAPLFLLFGLDIINRRKKYNKPIINYFNKTEMRKNIVAGNWKMNKTLQEGIELAKDLNAILANEKPNCDVVICTPFIHLASVTPLVDASKIAVGAENCADKESGAYTGETSAAMIASTGAKYVILGHSERRAYYGETSAILKDKVKLALANNLTPLFCIGEVLEEREANKQNEVVKAQLSEALFDLSAEDFAKIVIAYEPVWAIGTGKTATGEQAQEIHAYIRSVIADKYGKDVANNTSILYGGSCKASNAKELFANPDVDGGLIGGASLSAEDFKGVIDGFKA